MNLRRTQRNETGKPAEYTASTDFAKLFAEDMTGLYLLSYLLTANHEKAERCFVTGFEECAQGNVAFQQWARSWSRRTIVHHAIRMMSPHPGVPPGTLDAVYLAAESEPQGRRDEDIAIASVLSLGTFERFVFVLSVLERYHDQDCSVLLSCARNDARRARVRAFQQIGDFIRDLIAVDAPLKEAQQR